MSNNSEAWRLFIAVPLPSSVKQMIADWCKEQRDQLFFQKWVHKEDYHITVQFLGDTSPERLDELRSAAIRAVANIRPIHMEALGCGTFGRADQPRVLWAGVHGELELLEQLQNNVIEENRKLGYIPEDRPYRPHITLARKYRAGYKLETDITGANLQFGSWTIDALVIYRTNMHHQPMYEKVAEIPFAK
ncbi:RNA 2',3'-cyclic phosphodiesterase [Paenibacillus sp. 79R4]|uniref:RNA 2',3'-cyclic phosphodiesterase n=1 Tax=Paenibacillus sp. 79R4 TaxID=2212847 RepID=UPI0015B96990|nr:RNA 2',3'-cyclic phosphodiesterase [Paenibacillus sp. 79R4]NWL89903.1 RNA 2',3'-cyclic phosphodiesterase [Paenibacillus sp. 79R4]